mmetsp:Transcript_8660/g.20021  ORF Transcript_8660/g.20021 Transcript_8660/m.20021 type:complete len:354 (-) Transcript_8660:28-1089(-)
MCKGYCTRFLCPILIFFPCRCLYFRVSDMIFLEFTHWMKSVICEKVPEKRIECARNGYTLEVKIRERGHYLWSSNQFVLERSATYLQGCLFASCSNAPLPFVPSLQNDQILRRCGRGDFRCNATSAGGIIVNVFFYTLVHLHKWIGSCTTTRRWWWWRHEQVIIRCHKSFQCALVFLFLWSVLFCFCNIVHSGCRYRPRQGCCRFRMRNSQGSRSHERFPQVLQQFGDKFPIGKRSKDEFFSIHHGDTDARGPVQTNFHNIQKHHAESLFKAKQIGIIHNRSTGSVESPLLTMIGTCKISPTRTDSWSKQGVHNLRTRPFWQSQDSRSTLFQTCCCRFIIICRQNHPFCLLLV